MIFGAGSDRKKNFTKPDNRLLHRAFCKVTKMSFGGIWNNSFSGLTIRSCNSNFPTCSIVQFRTDTGIVEILVSIFSAL